VMPDVRPEDHADVIARAEVLQGGPDGRAVVGRRVTLVSDGFLVPDHPVGAADDTPSVVGTALLAGPGPSRTLLDADHDPEGRGVVGRDLQPGIGDLARVDSGRNLEPEACPGSVVGIEMRADDQVDPPRLE